MSLPPSSIGGSQVRVSSMLPGCTLKLLTSPGATAGVPVASGDHGPLPPAFTAATLSVYSVPLVRPGILVVVVLELCWRAVA